MTGEIVRVEFHGDTLEAVERDGKVWVAIRRCCENLGLAMESQLAKLKGKPWSCMTEIVMQVPGDTQGRSYAMVDLETLPGWLFSIDARKVKEEVREKLVRYQREAAKVLADHFLRGPRPAPAVDAVPAGLLWEVVAMLREEIQASREEMRALILETTKALAGRDAAPNAAHVGPYWTIDIRLLETYPDWNTTPAQRAKVRYYAKKFVDLGRGGDLVKFNRDLAFDARQLRFLDDAIRVVRREAETVGKVGDYGLFRERDVLLGRN